MLTLGSLKPRTLLPLIVALSCVSCTTGGSSVGACTALPVVAYSDQAQRAVAAEIQVAPADAVWPGWIVDYGRLRAAVRACVK